MANKKVKLLNQVGDELYPRTTMDNILTAAGSTVYANLVKLNGLGKIDAEYLPSYVDDVVELIAMQATAPATCAEGDLYFNSTNSKIYQATADNTWAETGTDPEKGVIYLNLANPSSTKIYRWSGSQMVEIYEQYATVTSVGPASGEGAATNSEVPTALAVRQAIVSAAYDMPPAGSAGTATELGGVYVGTNIDVNAGGTISVATAGVGSAGVVGLAAAADVTTSATNETTAVTPKGVATVLSSFQPKFTTSSNVTISAGTISVAAGDTSSAGIVRLATVEEAATTSAGVAVTPAGLQAELDGYQPLFTSSNNVTISDGTISVATGGVGTPGVLAVDSSTTSGVKLAVADGTVSAQGVAATTASAGVMRFATTAEVSAGSAVSAAVKPDDLATVLGGYQVQLTNQTNITVSGNSIAVATAGVGATSKGVIAVDQTASNGAALSITNGVVKVTLAAAAVGSAGAIALASTADTSSFTGSTTAVTPAGLGSALMYGVFYREV